jgi:hypothetical protein
MQQYDALVTDFNSKLDDIKNKYNYKFVEQIMTARLAESLDETATKESTTSCRKMGNFTLVSINIQLVDRFINVASRQE